MKIRYLSHILFFLFIFLPIISYAAGQGGVLDDSLIRYESQIGTWEASFKQAGLFIFWSLAAISVVMTGAQLIFQRENISSFFAEFIRLILFLGFFLWIITNGVSIATAIRDGLMQLAGQASGNGSTITPSGIVDIGFDLFKKIVEASSFWDPIDSAVLTIIGLIVLLILAVVGINMLLLMVTTYIVIYAGIFILGFGGGRWTSDMAIGYLKQVLNLSLQLASMILIIGIGQSIIETTVNSIGTPDYQILAVVLVQAALLVGLIVKIPPLVGSLAGGAGSHGIGSFGIGSAVAATAMLAGAAASAAAGLKSLVTEAAGLAKAFQAAKSNLGNPNDDSGGGKMGSAIEAIQDNNSVDNSKQDGKPLTTESGDESSSNTSENTVSSGFSPRSENWTTELEEISGNGQSQNADSGQSAKSAQSNSIDNNNGDFRQPENMISKTTNTGGGSPLAAAMGNNLKAAKQVTTGLVKNKWENTKSRVIEAVDKSAGGQLAKQWKKPKGKGNDDV